MKAINKIERTEIYCNANAIIENLNNRFNLERKLNEAIVEHLYNGHQMTEPNNGLVTVKFGKVKEHGNGWCEVSAKVYPTGSSKKNYRIVRVNYNAEKQNVWASLIVSVKNMTLDILLDMVDNGEVRDYIYEAYEAVKAEKEPERTDNSNEKTEETDMEEKDMKKTEELKAAVNTMKEIIESGCDWSLNLDKAYKEMFGAERKYYTANLMALEDDCEIDVTDENYRLICRVWGNDEKITECLIIILNWMKKKEDKAKAIAESEKEKCMSDYEEMKMDIEGLEPTMALDRLNMKYNWRVNDEIIKKYGYPTEVCYVLNTMNRVWDLMSYYDEECTPYISKLNEMLKGVDEDDMSFQFYEELEKNGVLDLFRLRNMGCEFPEKVNSCEEMEELFIGFTKKIVDMVMELIQEPENLKADEDFLSDTAMDAKLIAAMYHNDKKEVWRASRYITRGPISGLPFDMKGFQRDIDKKEERIYDREKLIEISEKYALKNIYQMPADDVNKNDNPKLWEATEKLWKIFRTGKKVEGVHEVMEIPIFEKGGEWYEDHKSEFYKDLVEKVENIKKNNPCMLCIKWNDDNMGISFRKDIDYDYDDDIYYGRMKYLRKGDSINELFKDLKSLKYRYEGFLIYGEQD